MLLRDGEVVLVAEEHQRLAAGHEDASLERGHGENDDLKKTKLSKMHF